MEFQPLSQKKLLKWFQILVQMTKFFPSLNNLQIFYGASPMGITVLLEHHQNSMLQCQL